MNENEKELWEAIDLTIFGTNDSDKILERLSRGYEKKAENDSTLGGALRSLRWRRHVSTKAIALQAGVSQSLWQSWEANRCAPTVPEFENACDNLKLCERTRQRLLGLRDSLPRLVLERLSRFQPDQMVARGVGRVDPLLEWRKLGVEVKCLLEKWAEDKGFSFPDQFLDVLDELKTPDDQKRWVNEVVGCDDDE